MHLVIEGFKKGLSLILNFNPEIYGILGLSLFVSLFAISIALCIGIPLGAFVAIKKFPFRRLVVSLINTGMAFPPVVIGLFVVMLLWRSGPLNFLGWLYNPQGMILAQTIIALPIVTGFSLAAIQSLDKRAYLEIQGLGANNWQTFWLLIKEARLAILAAIMAGLGSILSEVGAVMMVGGNIWSQTRVLTTAIVMETRMGNFDKAIALSLILLFLSFLINFGLTLIQQKRQDA